MTPKYCLFCKCFGVLTIDILRNKNNLVEKENLNVFFFLDHPKEHILGMMP